jgi:isopentenyl-diphosphate delta-isomerase
MKYDLVDFQDNFIKIGTKEEARKKKLFTRSVHIWLFNKKGELMICKRSANKKTYPNQFTSSAGGHVEQRENYKVTAKRELEEELGIVTSLKDLGRFDVITPKERAIHHLFIGKLNKNFFPDPSEISCFDFMPINVIKKDITSHPRKYCKPFLEAFKYYLALKK